MKKVLLVVTKKGQKKKHLTRRLNVLSAGKIEFKLVRLSDFTIEFNGKKVEVRVEGESVSNFDLVYFRRVGDMMSIAGSLAICFDALGLEVSRCIFQPHGSSSEQAFCFAQTFFVWATSAANPFLF